MKPQILINIDPDGNVHLDFDGYSGRACEDAENRLRQEVKTLGLDLSIANGRRKPDQPGLSRLVRPSSRTQTDH